jgi:hypothetical protein
VVVVVGAGVMSEAKYKSSLSASALPILFINPVTVADNAVNLDIGCLLIKITTAILPHITRPSASMASISPTSFTMEFLK